MNRRPPVRRPWWRRRTRARLLAYEDLTAPRAAEARFTPRVPLWRRLLPPGPRGLR